MLVDVLAAAMALRDPSIHSHAARVQRYAVSLALESGIDDRVTIQAIRTAALLHDIGKLRVPGELLKKPGPLTCAEFERVKQHAALGAEMLTGLCCTTALTLIVRHHHENWDGSGYPDRLASDRIPIGARVLAIVDCYDALTSERPYRRELSHAEAVEMIKERGGSMYDPSIVDVFLRTLAAAPLRAADHDWPAAFPDLRLHEAAPPSIVNPYETRA